MCSWQVNGKRVLLLGGVLAAVGNVARAQGPNMPDAQVEANVLRQLASAPELSTQNIHSSSVYGIVTLSGNVHDEAMRTKAENLVARAPGVKKVVDELTLGDSSAPAAAGEETTGTSRSESSAPPDGQVLQSDGTYAPAPAGSADQAANGITSQGGAPPYSDDSRNYHDPSGASARSGSPQPYLTQPGYPARQPGYPGNQQADQPGYGTMPSQPSPYPQAGRQPVYPNGYTPYPQNGEQGGQAGGQVVTVAAGSVLQVRLDRGFDANHVQPGTAFSGVVMQDIVASGAIAVPRGANVQGTVVDAKKAGVLKGEAELGLQINGLTLGGQNYAVSTEVWQREGRDKTVRTVNSALGLGALGAILGGVAGGGSGAAIGAAAGGAAGVAGSAASPAGHVIVPAEAVLTFRMSQPVSVTTVGQAELSRLSYAAGPVQRPVPARRYYSPYYGGYYYGPGYYR